MFRPLALTFALALGLTACGTRESTQTIEVGAALTATAGSETWEQTLLDARGQTVDWWLFGGDARINAYLDDVVAVAAREFDVTLRRVPIADTAEAVQRVAAEMASGRADGGGSVDMIWINGENFAAGAEAELWLSGWASRLPNRELLDAADATLTTDFGLPTQGQESPWSRAAFVLAHDPARSSGAPTSVHGLLDWAAANPGRFTYPAPPDFTGSAFVRQLVQALGEEEAFTALSQLQANLWRGGEAFPVDEAELNQLFGNGEVDFAMSYNPAFVAGEIERGTFADSVRPFTLDDGVLSNVSFVTIPANAQDQAGAQVIANLLLSPAMQAAKADPDVLGVPTVLDLTKLSAQEAALFARGEDPRILTQFTNLVAELPVSEVDRLEQRWLADVLGS
ncbi:MAG: putative spermidine/putrescine transport system substrate-binding protein [Glaciecola sp.]